MRAKSALASIGVAVLLAAMSGPALPVDSDPSPPISSDHATGKKAIEARDWNGAIKSLTAAARHDGRNADIQNLLGYAYRNAGQLDTAFKHYNQALQLDPRHLGAHEYIGEAYLMANNPAKAEEHLAQLKRLCPSVCEEYDDLSKKLAQYRARAK
jgi:tetratricopeptide (TPR) repeat protein